MTEKNISKTFLNEEKSSKTVITWVACDKSVSLWRFFNDKNISFQELSKMKLVEIYSNSSLTAKEQLVPLKSTEYKVWLYHLNNLFVNSGLSLNNFWNWTTQDVPILNLQHLYGHWCRNIHIFHVLVFT